MLAPGDSGQVRWLRDDSALWRVAAGGVVVLLGPADAEPRMLSGAGLSLWRLLAKPTTVDELANRLAAELAGEVAIVRSQIEPVLAALATCGAIREVQ